MTTNLPTDSVTFSLLMLFYGMMGTDDGDALVGMKSSGSQLLPFSSWPSIGAKEPCLLRQNMITIQSQLRRPNGEVDDT